MPNKLSLEKYIQLIDKELKEEGLTPKERDEMFNCDENADLVSQGYEKNKDPKAIAGEMDRNPVYLLHSKRMDEKRKPTTKKGKDKKFKKVMDEFSKGKLKPKHSDKPLDPKSEKDRKQALAIAYSESDLSEAVKRSLNEDRKKAHITPGMRYAIDFLEAFGFNLLSTDRQLRNGTLYFVSPENEEYAIFKTGYIRKKVGSKYDSRWQIINDYFTKFDHKLDKVVYIDDDTYKKLAELTYLIYKK